MLGISQALNCQGGLVSQELNCVGLVQSVASETHVFLTSLVQVFAIATQTGPVILGLTSRAAVKADEETIAGAVARRAGLTRVLQGIASSDDRAFPTSMTRVFARATQLAPAVLRLTARVATKAGLTSVARVALRLAGVTGVSKDNEA